MVNSKSTKTEILEAYHQLAQEKNELLAQINQLQSAAKNVPTTVKTTPEKLPVVPQNLAKQADIKQVISSLETLKFTFGSAVSNLSEKLIAEASKLNQIKAELASEIEQLKALHNIEEITETTLDDLIQEYECNAKNFGEELSLQEEYLQQQILELSQNWQKQKAIYQRQIQQRNDNYQKEKSRHEQDYQYNLQQQRQLSREEFEQQKQLLAKELAALKQQQEKSWQDQEEIISKKEREYSEAKQKVAAFEEHLKAKIKQGENEGKAIGNYQVKVKADLRNKEIEGERNIYQLRIQSLQDTIHHNQDRVDNLSRQLESALKQVQDLAVKAIEGTSNRNSYDAMKEIALEQAKNTQKSK
jgi:hypothetical protein